MKLASILLFICLVWSSANAQTSEQQIREARRLSNSAIAAHDSIAVASFWTDDFVLISSRNSEVHGKRENLHWLSKEFKSKPDVIYVRTSKQVDVYNDWNMASESGTWVGEWKTPEGRVKILGTYYAKWHKTESGWKIRAEVFTPLKCSGGSFCFEVPVFK